MKRKISLLLAAVLFFGAFLPISTIKSSALEYSQEINCKTAILMEASTGTVLYEKEADMPLPPASVTKIMTLLLVMEAIDAEKILFTDMVTVSEHAASMGGSQVYLEAGESMCVEDLLKCVIISSANDACVALAEHIAGSEESFVALMNTRAAELGMANTAFENTNGLDDTTEAHYTSARDIALMSQALLAHEKILEYSGIWTDSIRDGAFTLTNTNRLIRFYNGANGLKTGSTTKAGFCISATAKRDGMQLICVVMGAPTRDIRNNIARSLLDYGFANYALYTYPGKSGEISVLGSDKTSVSYTVPSVSAVIEKGMNEKISIREDLPSSVSAPIAAGDTIGTVHILLDGNEIASPRATADTDVVKITFFTYFLQLLRHFVSPSISL